MNGHVFAVELQDLDPRLSVLVKDGFGCCAVNDNGFRFQLFDGVLEASSEELAFALEDAKKQTVSTLLDIKVLPKTMTDGYGAWWHVGIASVSGKESVCEAYKSKEENLSKARKY